MFSIIEKNENDNSNVEFKLTTMLNTDVEVNYFRNEGILQAVLKNLVK